MMRWTLSALALLLAPLPLRAQTADTAAATENVKRVIELKFADCRTLARAFAKAPEVTEEALHQVRQQMLVAVMEDVYRHAPRPNRRPEGPDDVVAGRPRQYMDVRIAEELSGGGMADLLPEGVQPPVAAVDQNALIVTGTPVGVDKFRELVTMLDVPPRMVNVEAKFVEIGQRETRDSGLDWALRHPPLAIFEQGHVPAAGSVIRYMAGGIASALGSALTQSSESNVQAANVTTTNNTPCFIRVGQVIPYFIPTIEYNPFGQEVVTWEVDSTYTGLELFVLPRINADDTVTMLVRPTLSSPVGTVVGPNGQILPITDNVETEVIVRVPDGEELCIGGMNRASDTLNTGGIASRGMNNGIDDTDLLVFVRPTIIRDVTPMQ